MAIAARAIKPDIELIGVEAELYPSMKCAIEGCNMPFGGDTLAEGIAVKKPGELTCADPQGPRGRSHARRGARPRARGGDAGRASKRASSKARARRASRRCSPTRQRFAGKKVGTILCGGNIDTHLLANVLVRDLVRQGRIARLRVAAQDRPGALAAITAKFHEAGVNIIEINHSRIFTRLPAKDTVIEVECEARDAAGDRRCRESGWKPPDFHVERASLD